MNISLKRSTSGIQYAGWEPRAVAMEGLGDRVLPDQRIPIDADCKLHADVYLPKAPGRYPAVVSFGCYNTDLFTAEVPSGANEIGSPPVFTERGYAPVVIERRGVGAQPAIAPGGARRPPVRCLRPVRARGHCG